MLENKLISPQLIQTSIQLEHCLPEHQFSLILRPSPFPKTALLPGIFMKTDQNQVWGSNLQSSPAEENVLFCAGRDVQPLPMADLALLPYDLWTNRAHAIMWFEEGVIPKDVLTKILGGLNLLEEQFLEGNFKT